jgi:hypothetical protein
MAEDPGMSRQPIVFGPPAKAQHSSVDQSSTNGQGFANFVLSAVYTHFSLWTAPQYGERIVLGKFAAPIPSRPGEFVTIKPGDITINRRQ